MGSISNAIRRMVEASEEWEAKHREKARSFDDSSRRKWARKDMVNADKWSAKSEGRAPTARGELLGGPQVDDAIGVMVDEIVPDRLSAYVVARIPQSTRYTEAREAVSRGLGRRSTSEMERISTQALDELRREPFPRDDVVSKIVAALDDFRRMP